MLLIDTTICVSFITAVSSIKFLVIKLLELSMAKTKIGDGKSQKQKLDSSKMLLINYFCHEKFPIYGIAGFSSQLVNSLPYTGVDQERGCVRVHANARALSRLPTTYVQYIGLYTLTPFLL